MLFVVEVLLSAVLLGLAALHVYWGLGGYWPGSDEITAARTVAGFKGVTRMPPPPACFAVAIALIVAGAWPLLLSGRLSIPAADPLVRPVGVLLMMVFLARGVAAYLPAWRKLTPELQFARLDQMIYGPLCLAIGGAFAALLFA